jgi:hypothetical protein
MLISISSIRHLAVPSANDYLSELANFCLLMSSLSFQFLQRQLQAATKQGRLKSRQTNFISYSPYSPHRRTWCSLELAQWRLLTEGGGVVTRLSSACLHAFHWSHVRTRPKILHISWLGISSTNDTYSLSSPVVYIASGLKYS